METKKALKIAGIATGAVLTLLITAVVILPKIISKKNENKNKETKPSNTNSTSNSTTPSVEVPNPIGNINDIKKFQDWMDTKHPNWLDNKTSLNKGFGYGNYGSQTTKAWIKYSTEYQTAGNKPTSTKIHKAYSKIAYNPIYKDVHDWIPYRLAGNSEYLGDLTGVVKKDYNGNAYLELKQTNGLYYALYNTVKLTK